MALHYILDGYNIIKCMDGLADLSLEDGRSALLKILSFQRPQGSARNDVTVVFDGRSDVWGPTPSGPTKVVFTSGETADEYIKRAVEGAKDLKNVVVVTNDGEICCYVRKLGAKVLSVLEFLTLRSGAGSRNRSQSGVSGELKKQKHIPRVTQSQINKELEDIWIKKKRS